MNKILTIILTLTILSQTVVSVTAQEATPGDVVDEASATGSQIISSTLNHVNQGYITRYGPFTVFAPTDQALPMLINLAITQMPKTDTIQHIALPRMLAVQ